VLGPRGSNGKREENKTVDAKGDRERKGPGLSQVPKRCADLHKEKRRGKVHDRKEKKETPSSEYGKGGKKDKKRCPTKTSN